SKFIYSVDEFKTASLENIKSDLSVKILDAYQELEKNKPNDLNLILKRVENLENVFVDENLKRLSFLNQIGKRFHNDSLTQNVLLKKAQTFELMASEESHSNYYKNAVCALDSILKNKNRSNTYKQ